MYLTKEDYLSVYPDACFPVPSTVEWKENEDKTVRVIGYLVPAVCGFGMFKESVKNHFELANGNTITIYEKRSGGSSWGDITLYYYAFVGSKLVSRLTTSCWNSDRYDYPEWINQLKEKYSRVEVALTAVAAVMS